MKFSPIFIKIFLFRCANIGRKRRTIQSATSSQELEKNESVIMEKLKSFVCRLVVRLEHVKKKLDTAETLPQTKTGFK